MFETTIVTAAKEGGRERERFHVWKSRSIPLWNRMALPFCSKCTFRRHTPFRLSPPEQEDPSILYADLISFQAPPTLHRILFHATDTFNKYRDEAIEGREDFDKFVEYFLVLGNFLFHWRIRKVDSLLLRRILNPQSYNPTRNVRSFLFLKYL